MPIFSLLIILILVLWLISEFKWKRGIRIFLGTLSIFPIAGLAIPLGQIERDYTNSNYRQCIKLSHDLLTNGNNEVVIDGYEKYLSSSTNSVSDLVLANELLGRLINKK